MSNSDNQLSAEESQASVFDRDMSSKTKQFIYGSGHVGSDLPQTQVLAEVTKDKACADELKGYLDATECSSKTESDTCHNSTPDSREKESTESFNEWAFTIQDSRFAKMEKKAAAGGEAASDSQQTVTSLEMRRAEEIAGPYLDGKKVVRFNLDKNEVCTQQKVLSESNKL